MASTAGCGRGGGKSWVHRGGQAAAPVLLTAQDWDGHSRQLVELARQVLHTLAVLLLAAWVAVPAAVVLAAGLVQGTAQFRGALAVLRGRRPDAAPDRDVADYAQKLPGDLLLQPVGADLRHYAGLQRLATRPRPCSEKRLGRSRFMIFWWYNDVAM
jgi:hypothetical protein